jgi:hypothetical protein
MTRGIRRTIADNQGATGGGIMVDGPFGNVYLANDTVADNTASI